MGVRAYVGLYGSGLFNFGSYVSLFTCFLGFDVPASFIFIENVFIISIPLVHYNHTHSNICESTNFAYILYCVLYFIYTS